jgi:hypothetical protein
MSCDHKQEQCDDENQNNAGAGNSASCAIMQTPQPHLPDNTTPIGHSGTAGERKKTVSLIADLCGPLQSTDRSYCGLVECNLLHARRDKKAVMLQTHVKDSRESVQQPACVQRIPVACTTLWLTGMHPLAIELIALSPACLWLQLR